MTDIVWIIPAGFGEHQDFALPCQGCRAGRTRSCWLCLLRGCSSSYLQGKGAQTSPMCCGVSHIELPGALPGTECLHVGACALALPVLWCLCSLWSPLCLHELLRGEPHLWVRRNPLLPANKQGQKGTLLPTRADLRGVRVGKRAIASTEQGEPVNPTRELCALPAQHVFPRSCVWLAHWHWHSPTQPA